MFVEFIVSSFFLFFFKEWQCILDIMNINFIGLTLLMLADDKPWVVMSVDMLHCLKFTL